MSQYSENAVQVIPIERTNEAFEFDQQLTVVGQKLSVGESAPNFHLEFFDPAAGTIRISTLADTRGSVRLLNVINSIDTPICHTETCTWEKMNLDAPEGIRVLTISMDLPFALDRWRNAESVSHQTLSAHQSDAFGIDYGVLLKEWRLLQRAVFVLDQQDRIVYAEYVSDQMQQPNFAAAFESAIAAL